MVNSNSIVMPYITERVKHEQQVSQIPETLSNTVGIFTIAKGTFIAGGPWKIATDSVAEIRHEGSNFIAVHYDVDEYGIGNSSEEAVADLLISLIDYRTSLEKRENKLAAKERSDLDRLKRLLQR